MADIHQFPSLSEQQRARRILRDIMMEQWCREPLGDWDVPAVAGYVFDRLLEEGWRITRI